MADMAERTTDTGDRAFRWGLLGTARINRAVIPPLRASQDNRLLAVASRDAARAAAYAREWGIERAHGSYEALLQDGEIDAVYIPLPNHMHAEWAIRAAAAGKHVLCEKPLALSVAEVDAVAAAAREHGVVIAEAFMYRHHPQTLKVKQLVGDGAIGELRFVRGSFSFPLDNPDDYRLRPEQGGGSLWDVGCYPLSFTRFLLGQEPVEVFGAQTTGPTGVDLTFAGQLVFANGVLAQIDSGFASAFRAEMEVTGTKGVLRVRHPWKPLADQPILLARGDQTEAVPVEAKDRYLLEIEDLAEAARARRAPRVTLAESRGNVATIVALLRSARENRPMRLQA
jgi:D-xylose 1-dehydrogenase (NADP+, D-xylono-1,5-lactone-forming)